MAVYKVPQDVEADDKLIGPFSFKQFVFILIAVGMLWFAYVLARITPFVAIAPAILAIPFLILGLPLRKEQPTDVYIAALINFFMRPKVRTWSQEGVTEHVHVTAPKKAETHISDGLSRNEVESRLNNLARTMDTRGWAVKNVDPITAKAMASQSDRLVGPEFSLTPEDNMQDVDDVMDARNSAVAQKFAELEAEAARKRGDVVTAQNLQPEQGADQPEAVMPGSVIMPGQQPQQASQPQDHNEPQLLNQNAPQNNPFPQMQQRTINPLHSKDEINQLESDIAGVVNPSTQPAPTPQPAPVPEPTPAPTPQPQPSPEPPVTETPTTDTIDVNNPLEGQQTNAQTPNSGEIEGGGEIHLR